MDVAILLSFICSFYFFLWFSNSIFTSCMHYPYITFLKETGLSVGFFNFSWQTGFFNRRLYRWGRSSLKFLNTWFNIGTVCALVLLPIALVVLVNTGLRSYSNTNEVSSLPVIEPAIPGVNIPSTDFSFYIISLIITSCIHELGHAIAATREDVQVLSVGFHVVFMLPIAYVNLNSNHLAGLSIYRRLRIYCAGIWHNIVLGLTIYLLLMSMPTLLSFAFKLKEGVQVIEIHPKSPLLASESFAVNDIITKINYHKIRSKDDWDKVFQDMLHEKFGFCVTADFVHQYDESVGAKHTNNGLIDCCEEGSGNVCFEYIEPDFSVVRLPQHMCLPVRKITNYGFHKCYEKDNYICRIDYNCIKPLIHNSTSFVIIERLDKNDVLYLGYPSDVYRTIFVSRYIPKIGFLPSTIPEFIEKLLKYIIIFSCGLAVINVVPCYGLDGHYISRCLVEFIFRKRLQNIVTLCYVLCGTMVTVVSLVFTFYRTFT